MDVGNTLSGLITARKEIPEARKRSGTEIYIIPLLYTFVKHPQTQPLQQRPAMQMCLNIVK